MFFADENGHPLSMRRSLGLIVCGILVGVMLWFLAKYVVGEQWAPLAWVLLSPTMILWLVPGMIGVAIAVNQSVKASHWAQWNGRYYEFRGTQIRVDVRDDGVWLCGPDLLRALKEAPILRRAVKNSPFALHSQEHRTWMLSSVVLLRILNGSKEFAGQRMILWLTRDLVPALVRRHEHDRKHKGPADVDEPFMD